jgi:hypothetical protein
LWICGNVVEEHQKCEVHVASYAYDKEEPLILKSYT